ncbi:TPA: hypothetical protein ACS705_003139 [Providencia alcalifaciens]|uniref:hypothetical protein n=2 Tax=Providencia alcalifaciens TaxID=126385 RepID=UPI0012B60D0A|nr:hypothetical protein [Providencia alcalifaciens]MTC32716.1 hypothetical protein [Providencia alcalifaciens]
MPSVTNLQKAAFDAIDTLHFNQIVMGLICRESIEEWYPWIINGINKILKKAGLTGKEAEITKHYLLSALEIRLTADDKYLSDVAKSFKELNPDVPSYNRETFEKVTNHERTFCIAMLSIIANQNGVTTEFLLQATEELMNDEVLALSTMPFIIRYRLTECCYAYEYPDAPFLFYHELVNRNIIACGKYSRKTDKYMKELNSELSLLFIRAGLLFELKMLQRMLEAKISYQKNGTIVLPKLDAEISRTDRKLLADYYKRLVDLLLEGKEEGTFVVFKCKEHVSVIKAQKFLNNMNRFYFHKRMFGGTQGSWLGTLGALEIELCCGEEPKLAIYYEADNSLAISEKVKSKFFDYGFSVSARSLYLRHKTIKKDGYSKIRYYCSMLLGQQYMLSWHSNRDGYYDLALKYKKKDVSK